MKEIAGSFLTFLGRSILGFLLIFLGLTGPCAMTAFAQEQEKKPPYTPETAPVWLRATPAATNVLTTFEVHNGEVNFRHIEAFWNVGGTLLGLSVWFEGTRGTNVTAVELNNYAAEKVCEWGKGKTVTAERAFPPFMEERWCTFAAELQRRYTVIGDGIYVETSPVKYVAEVPYITDGVILTKHLLLDGTGKYRVLDAFDVVGEFPKVGESFYLGATASSRFTVEKIGEKFLLAPGVVTAIQREERERQRLSRSVSAEKK